MLENNDLEDVINSYKGIKKIIARVIIKINAPILRIFYGKISAVYESLDRYSQENQDAFEHMNGQIQGLDQGIEAAVKTIQHINEQLKGYEGALENIRDINRQLEGYEGVLENVRNNNKQLEGFENIVINLRNNNSRLEKIDSMMDMYGVKISKLEKEKKRYGIAVAGEKEEQANHEYTKKIQNADSAYDSLDYFEFENYFRGSREEIKRNQSIYLKYFEEKDHVMDLGCGRGEFLELMREHGIGGYGVDLYQEFVDLCTVKGLKAVCTDAITALECEEKADGIFAGQLIEHLSLGQLLHLIEVAYHKLLPDAYLIMETPNPMSLAIYTHAFYMDPSHNKPVHPLTIKYLLEKAGFRNVEIIFTESSRLPVEIPELKADHIENIGAFNKAMEEVQRTLFGSQDYAVVAQK